MNKHKSNKIKENSNTVRHLIMGQIITTQSLVAIKEVRHAGQQRPLPHGIRELNLQASITQQDFATNIFSCATLWKADVTCCFDRFRARWSRREGADKDDAVKNTEKQISLCWRTVCGYRLLHSPSLVAVADCQWAETWSVIGGITLLRVFGLNIWIGIASIVMDCWLTWPVGISTVFRGQLTVRLYSSAAGFCVVWGGCERVYVWLGCCRPVLPRCWTCCLPCCCTFLISSMCSQMSWHPIGVLFRCGNSITHRFKNPTSVPEPILGR